jgi:hypothetical protein
MAVMELREALAVLGVAPGTPMEEVRVHYRRLVRARHPDLRGDADAFVRTAEVTTAFAVVRAAVREHGTGIVPEPSPVPPPAHPDPPPAAHRRNHPADVDALESDTIAITAPPPEAYALLLDAAAQVGSVGYVDRHLGLLEILVRFEGGPTCSVLLTIQGRAFTTEVVCTMDSIEAAPTPPLRPVVEALVEALRHPA